MKTLKTLTLLASVLMLSGMIIPVNIPYEKSEVLSRSCRELSWSLGDSDSMSVWVFFKNKPSKYEYGKNAAISDRSYNRRFLRKAALFDDFDITVDQEYIQLVSETGFRVRHVSRWLNAASGYIAKKDLDQLSRLPVISAIDIVHSVKNKKEIPSDQKKIIHDELSFGVDSVIFDSAFYGYSFTQNRIVNVPAVHSAGFFGQGVIVAVFDAGFNNLQHEVFDSLQLLATWDFVNGDTSVADDPGQLGNGTHGTNVLSVIAGYKPGKLIGPAFRSGYLLAKTENTESETSTEEDNWIAALEWAENAGADIVSSSVAYREMDPGSPRSYDWTWMDGDSTYITKAANIAAGKGVIMVNSAGNEGDDNQHNTLDAPADGKMVIAAGSVDYRGIRAVSSSVGPTIRGRIKPDVMAMGVNVTVAGSLSSNHYTTSGGTSLSCPMVAGICALMLSAHPELTVNEVMTGLHRNSSRSKNPDNKYGYGIVNAFKSVNYFNPPLPPDHHTLYQNFPNPFSINTTLRFYLTNEERVTIRIYNILGQEIAKLADRTFPAGFQESVIWNGKNSNGQIVSSGIYICRIETTSWKKSRKMVFLKK